MLENEKAEILRKIGQSWAVFKKLRFILKNRDVPIHLKRKIITVAYSL